MRSTVLGENSSFQPDGAEPESSTCSAGAVPVLVRMTGIEVSTPADARALSRPSRPLMSILGWPVMSSARSLVAVASSAETLATMLYLPAADRVRRLDLELDVLRLAGVERQGVELLAAVLLGEGGVEILRRGGRERDRDLLAAVVLDAQREFEVRLRVAAQFGKLRVQGELGRQIGGEGHDNRQAGGERTTLRVDRQIGGADRRVLRHVEAKLERDAGIGRRQRRRDRLTAADQGHGPALRYARDRQQQPLGRQAVILQLEAHRRRRAGTERDGRIVGQKEQSLDVVLGLFGTRLPAEGGKSKEHSRKESDNPISHDDRLQTVMLMIPFVFDPSRRHRTSRGYDTRVSLVLAAESITSAIIFWQG